MAISKHLNTQYDSLPDLPNYDPKPADGVRVGESPVPGITLKRILRGHRKLINRIAWSPDGRFLASPSEDKTIRIWDVARGKCTAVLKGHDDEVREVTWSPDGQMLASAGLSSEVLIWETRTRKILQTLKGYKGIIPRVAYSPNGRIIAVVGQGRKIELRDTSTWEILRELKGHSDFINCMSWSPEGKVLISGSANQDKDARLWNPENGRLMKTLVGNPDDVALWSAAWSSDGRLLATGNGGKGVHIWDTETWQERTILEGHTDVVTNFSFSFDNSVLMSQDIANTLFLWKTSVWAEIARISFSGDRRFFARKASFHPCLPILATHNEQDTVVCIWDLDMDVLLGQKAAGAVRYTTAKLVLVGDSGVGKTGLGWRLAHGEFKEHASTHGQQFWVIDDLGTTRADGTQCEAVLWDLAGQHVYRPIHSIFLDNVDAALVLFDPSNRQDPLKGAQFWLEQLKGKGQLPPSLLVGARVDRGTPAVAHDHLAQFCQRYGISGGYLGTSAKSGQGLDELIELLQEQIPWDAMTTTVTTVTFKRIKDYVLALKEKPDRKGVLVRPTELREQLEAAWKERPFDFAQGDEKQVEWVFTDAEMMTAVGHLQTHGYVTILRSSSGETTILLAPDLLVDLASSIVLLADKHPRELGAVSETELLQGRYAFDELAGLDEAERHILLDAAVLRFLEHHVCFRETFGSDTLLIFPGLIKQKRPLEDDFPATDDVSYVVRGRVENLYAMLVVLLGYTPSFIRINQWQNQAQYEMGQAEICGFRLIEDREGEIELVLYYSEQMPQRGRQQFQELFERFLYQREVEVTRFPPVVCPQRHRLDRATVIRLIREGKTFAFCAECGGRVDLPELDKPSIGIGAAIWLQREEAAARLRSTYEIYLSSVKSYRRGWATPRCYLSRVPGQEDCVTNLMHDLKDAGVYIVEEAAQVQPDDYVVMLDTPAYQGHWKYPTQSFAADVKLVKDRMAGGKRRLISIVLEGKPKSADPHDLRGCTRGDFCDATHYPVSLFNLVLELYAIPFTHAGFAPLLESLHQQWEQTLAGTEERSWETRKRFDVALSFPGEQRAFVKSVADLLARQLGRERVFYDAYYEAELARPDMDTYLQEIYHDQAELVVVFLCAEYEKKEWCRLEWRAVRDLLKQKKTAEIMPVRLDDTHIPGLFSIDGYIDAEGREPAEIADLIVQRLGLNRKATL